MDKGTGIEPVLERMHTRAGLAGWVRRNLATHIGVTDFVRTVHAQKVVVKEVAGFIGTVDYEKWEARCGSDDGIRFPVAEDGIDRSAPNWAQRLPLAKGQVIEKAACKTVIEIELRKTPIELLRSRERPVNRSNVSTKAIGHAGIEVAGPGVANQRVNAMADALGLRLYLERVVARRADAVVTVDDVALREWQVRDSTANV